MSTNLSTQKLKCILGAFIHIDVEKKLISSAICSPLGIHPNNVNQYVTGEIVCQSSSAAPFQPQPAYFLTIQQVYELCAKAPKSDDMPQVLSEFETEILPLLNQQPTQVKHDDFKKEINIMDSLTTPNQPLTMSSLEIAEMCEKQHAHVMRDIKTMLEQLEITNSNFGCSYKDITGRTLPMFKLDKEHSLCLVAGYNVKYRMKIIKRWQELENKVTAPVIKLPNMKELAHMLIQSEEEKEKLQLELKTTNEQIEKDKDYTNLGKIVGMSENTILISQYVALLQNEHGLKVGEKRGFEYFREGGYLCKEEHEKNRPTQKAMDMGLFTYTERPIPTNHGIIISFTPRLTAKGQLYFLDKFKKAFKIEQKSKKSTGVANSENV